MVTSFSAAVHVRSLLDRMNTALADMIQTPASSTDVDLSCVALDKALRSQFAEPYGAEKKKLVAVYAQLRISQMKKALHAQATHGSSEELKRSTTEFLLFSVLAAGALNQKPLLDSVKHHWVPVCYQRGFTTSPNSERREVRVEQYKHVTKDGKLTVHHETRAAERLFVHEGSTVGRGGFYSTVAEDFFGRVETAYSGLRRPGSTQHSAWSETVLYAFWAVQFIRTPEKLVNGKGEGFANNQKLYERLFAAVDMFSTPHVQKADGLRDLLFCPLFPRKGRFTAVTGMACVFPISATQGVVLSERKVTKEEAQHAMVNSQRTLVKTAQLKSTLLFGK
jgi:hypothetical protein